MRVILNEYKIFSKLILETLLHTKTYDTISIE